MKKKTLLPKYCFSALAFALLWATQGLYYFLEFNLNTQIYIFEGIWCVIVLSLCILGAPRLVSFLANLAGFIALINVYALKEGTDNLNQYAPILLFGILLFVVWQYESKKDNLIIEQISQNLFLIIPVILLALIVFGIIKNNIQFSINTVYFVLISLFVACLYFVSAKLFNENKGGNKNELKKRTCFIIAGVLILESAAYSIVFSRLELSNCVPLMWIVSYLILLEFKNPVCVNASAKFKSLINSFLKPENRD